MNKGIYLLLVCVLAAVAAVGTFSVGKLKAVDCVDLSDPREGKNKGDEVEPPVIAPVNRMESATAQLQDLWEMTLFKPERTEAEESADSPVIAAEQEVNAEFELAGIARIGLPGEAQPVAIIRLRQRPNRNPRDRGRAGGGRPDGPPQRGGREAPRQEEPTENVKTVFKRGDSINNTGYMLSAIYPDEKYVELSRGRDIIKLYIDYDSEASQARRKTAVAREEALKKQRTNEQEAQAREAADLAARNAANGAKPPVQQPAEGAVLGDAINNTMAPVAQGGAPQQGMRMRGGNRDNQNNQGQPGQPSMGNQQPPSPPGTRNGGGRGSSSGGGNERMFRMNGVRQRQR